MSVKGLPNIGLTCYINSVLQAFYYVDDFRKFILETEFSNPDSFVFYFQILFKHLAEVNSIVEELEIMCAVFKSFCERFTETKQGDANHFLTFILNKLNTEIGLHFDSESGKLAERQGDRNIISHLFRGEQEDRIICFKCSDTDDRKTTQGFFTLPLTANNKKECELDKMMLDFLSMTMVQNLNCRQCNEALYKHTIVTRWPEYLIINFCRGQPDNKGNIVKINTNVLVKDHRLVVLDNSALYKTKVGEAEKIEFILQATINHFGNAYSGHYTSYCKTDFSWLEFNDLSVRSIDESSVINRDNNLLFFRKVKPIKPTQSLIPLVSQV